MWFGIIFLSVTFVTLAWFVYHFMRNDRVYLFRVSLLLKVHDIASKQLDKEWEWRYEALNKVTYDEMLYSFKRLRPESFYKDLSFLEE